MQKDPWLNDDAVADAAASIRKVGFGKPFVVDIEGARP